MHAFFQVFFGGNTVYRSLIAVVNQCEFLFGTGLRKMSDFARFLRHRGSKRELGYIKGDDEKKKKACARIVWENHGFLSVRILSFRYCPLVWLVSYPSLLFSQPIEKARLLC